MPKKKPQLPSTRKRSRILLLLEDEDRMGLIREMAETGASISTINAKLGWPDNALSNLLSKGKHAEKGPYRRFYKLFRIWAADAKWAAESNLAKRSPEKFLDRSTTSKMIEDSDDASLANISNTTPTALPPGVEAKTIMNSMKILRQQGISIDEAIDKGQLNLADPNNPDEEEPTE